MCFCETWAELRAKSEESLQMEHLLRIRAREQTEWQTSQKVLRKTGDNDPIVTNIRAWEPTRPRSVSGVGLKIEIQRLVLWHSELSHTCDATVSWTPWLECPAPLSIQFPVGCLGKQWEMAQVLRPLNSYGRPKGNSWLLSLN